MSLANPLARLLRQEDPPFFTPTGLNRECYLDLMELSLAGYTVEKIRSMMPNPGEPVEDIQAFSRIALLLGILLANGRKQAHRDLFVEMMDLCTFTVSRKKGDTRNDFSVKEIMLALRGVKKLFSNSQMQTWLDEMARVDPRQNYTEFLKHPDDPPLHNINIYNMAGEYLRELEGLTSTDAYFDLHWPMQLKRFDENGMYMDPNCPMLYDLTTRCQIELILGQGYGGPYAQTLDEKLEQAGLYTLFMQSVTGQFPFGGRSNQFLFNEALIAANAEYEACRCNSQGKRRLAGMYKRCAHLAVQSIRRWVSSKPPCHIKNFYPQNSLLGCEDYGYYDKYMATLGSFIYIAFLYTDDTIPECPCPAETGGFVFETGDAFHKAFANNGSYFLEWDTRPDLHYDCAGLGRIHKKGVPSELILSVPITAQPSYRIERENPHNLSFSPGWLDETGKTTFLYDLASPSHTLSLLREEAGHLTFVLTWYGEGITGCSSIRETYDITEEGISLSVELTDAKYPDVFYAIPLFFQNGRDTSVITCSRQAVSVSCNGSVCRIRASAPLQKDPHTYQNRNGVYHAAYVHASSSRLHIHLSAGPAEESPLSVFELSQGGCS